MRRQLVLSLPWCFLLCLSDSVASRSITWSQYIVKTPIKSKRVTDIIVRCVHCKWFQSPPLCYVAIYSADHVDGVIGGTERSRRQHEVFKQVIST